MEYRLLRLSLTLLLCLLVVGCNASQSGKKYWYSVLPKTPLPKALQDLFQTETGSKSFVEKDNGGMTIDERQKLEIVKDIAALHRDLKKLQKINHQLMNDHSPTKDFSEILKDVSVTYGKPKNSPDQTEDPAAPAKGLSENIKDVSIIYNTPRHSQDKDLQQNDASSSKGFSKIMKDVSVAYGKPMQSAASKDLSEIAKDVSIIYDDQLNSQKKNIDPSTLSNDLSKIMKDVSIAYERKISENSNDLSKFMKDVSIYGKSKNSQQMNGDLSEIMKDVSVIYNSQKRNVNDLSSSNDFTKIMKDVSIAYEKKNPEETLSDDVASSSDLSKFMKDVSIYGKSKNSQQMNFQKEDLSEIMKDVSIIYNSQKRNINDLSSSNDFSKIMKDVSIAYEKKNPEQTLSDDDVASSSDLSKLMKDVSIYKKSKNSQQMNLENGDSASSKDLSEITKDVSIIYENKMDSQRKNIDIPSSANGFSKLTKDVSIAYEKKNSEETLSDDFSKIMKDVSIAYEQKTPEKTLSDDLASSNDLSKFMKDVSIYEKSKSKSQQMTLQYEDSVPSDDVSDTVKDVSIIHDNSRNLQKMKNNLQHGPSKTCIYGKSRNSQMSSAPNKDSTKMHHHNDQESAKNAIQDRTVFYMYNDLRPGKKMTLLFTNAGNKVDFLPRQVAEKIPFSSDKVPQILNRFSIDPKSADAEVIKDTIGDCENHQSEELFKHCATSVESLVDQNVARLGRNIRVLSTPEGKKQEYTVLAGTRKISDDRVIVCHKERYPYAVYYCHEINDTEVYRVALMGADGTRLKAVTICHKDTSVWNPDYIAFQTLKTQPGQPFCHFLSSDALVWFQTKVPGHDLMTNLQSILTEVAMDI